MEFTQELLDRLNDNPLYHTLGIVVEFARDGKARSALTPEENVCWPFPGQPHGGILFTQMDTTMAWSVLAELEPGHNCATINLDIQYTYPAKKPPLVCEARVTHKTSKLCFVQGTVTDADGRLLAMGQATFRVVKSDAMF